MSKRITPARAVLAVVIVLVGISACSSSKGSATATHRSSSSPSASTDSVTIKDYAFSPRSITVAAGATVTWTNDDQFAHAVKDPATGQDGARNIDPKATYTHTYSKPGTYPYVCAIHPNMHGTVVVTAPEPRNPPSLPPSHPPTTRKGVRPMTTHQRNDLTTDHPALDVSRLDDLVARVDDAHRASMAGLDGEIGELHHGVGAEHLGEARSHTLRNAALAGGALALGSQLLPYNQLLASAGVSAKLTDADIAGYAQSVELAAVAAYTAAAAKITTPAVLGAAKAFLAHHQDHANAFGAAAGSSAPGVANATILKSVGGQIAGAANESAVLEIAFTVENAAAATYLFAIGALTSADALMLTASILPIEAQHAAVLGTVLQKDLKALFPDNGRSFETTTAALAPDKNPIK